MAYIEGPWGWVKEGMEIHAGDPLFAVIPFMNKDWHDSDIDGLGNLIAAAPDLLDAAKRMLDESSIREDSDPYRMALRAAVEKAEGK